MLNIFLEIVSQILWICGTFYLSRECIVLMANVRYSPQIFLLRLSLDLRAT